MPRGNLDVLGVGNQVTPLVLGVGHHVACLGERHHVASFPCLLTCYVSFNVPCEELGERHPTDIPDRIAAFSACREVALTWKTGRELQWLKAPVC